MSALYLLLTLAFAGVLVLFLLRPGVARPTVVWGLAALLPLLAALAGSLGAQARAARVLQEYLPQDTSVTLNDGVLSQTVPLSAQEAACLERALRLRSKVTLVTSTAQVKLSEKVRLEAGELPAPRFVEALTLRGELHCPNLKATAEKGK